MPRRKIGKIREVKVDLASYSYMINGTAGIGKTTSVCEIGQKEFGVDGFLLLTIGREPEPEHIGNLWNEVAKDWDDLEEIIDTLCEYKNEDYPNLKMIGYDSVDEVFRLAEEKVVQLHNKKVANPSDRIDTIKSAFGGYQAGERKVISMVSELLFKIEDYGITPFFIGHTKQKNKSDQLTEIEFEQITSNLSSAYFNCIKDKVNVVMCAYMEREFTDIQKRKDAFTKTMKDIGAIASEKRVVSFRDESYALDVKSHLKYICSKCDLDSDTIIRELKDAMKKQAESFHGEMSDKDIEKKAEIERQELAQKVEETKQDKVEEVDELVIKKEKLAKITANFKSMDVVKLKEIMAKYSITNFANPDIVPMEALDEILTLL